MMKRKLSFLILLSLVAAQPAMAVTVDGDTIKQRKILVHRSLLNIYIAQRRQADAFKEFEYMIALTPTDSKLRFEYGTHLGRAGKYGAAIEQYKKAASLDPTNADIWGAIGSTYLRMKNPQAALEYLKKAIQFGGTQYQKQYEDTYKYIEYMERKKQYDKKQAEYRKKLEQQRKSRQEEEDDNDDW